MFRLLDRLLAYGSGEFLLNTRPNGGVVVFARAAITTIVTYSCALALRESLRAEATFAFSSRALATAVVDTIPWLGAVFAASYAAFYTRFASQWSYLADLYNQIMGAQVTSPQRDEKADHALAAWKAGFVEDAEAVHLHRKPVYAWAILDMLSETLVRELYVKSTAGGENRLKRVEKEVRESLEAEEARQQRLSGS
jgi:hypothetical protein